MFRKTPYSSARLLGGIALMAVFYLLSFGQQVFAQSQATTGQIVGTIRDSTGAAIPSAKVSATNKNTGLTQSATSTEAGLFRLVLLPPGVYDLTAEASGFSPVKLNELTVLVGQTADANITLGVGSVQEAITITAEGVQTTTVQPDALINETAISNLPINGRRFQDFVTLTPSAQVDPQRGQISLSGQRGINSNINVDGVDYNQPFFGGIRGGERSNTAFTIPQESIKEFQVVAAGYSAEFGRSTGGVVNAVTKGGTNSYSGTAFYLHRDKEFVRTNEYFEGLSAFLGRTVIPAPTQQQWGGSFGGPLKKDKFFFFGSYEQQRLRNPRQVLFDRLQGFTPTATTQEAFNFYKSLETPFEATNDALALLGRVDYNFSEANRFNIRYNWSRNQALNANATGNAIFPATVSALSNNGTEKNSTNNVVGQLTSFFGGNLVNELRGQWARERRPRQANVQAPTVGNAIGNFGTVSFLPTTQFDWRAQVFNNLTWIQGDHTMKFGAEINHVFIDQTFAFNQFGAFSFLTNDTATLLDILSFTPGAGTIVNRLDSTQVQYRRQIGNGRLDFSSDEYSMFAQDAWRIRPNFTLNYGLRWEGQFNPSPQANNSVLINQVRGFNFPSGHTVDPTRIPDNADQLAPRAGFAWDPFSNSKTVLRGYGGIYYARSPGLLFAAPLNNFRDPAGDLSILFPLATTSLATTNPLRSCNTIYCQLNLIGINLNNFTLDKLPVVTVEQARSIAQALGLPNFNPFTGVAPITWAQDYQNPRSYQWGASFEHQLAGGLAVGVEYSHVKTVYLQRNRDLNLPTPLASIGEMSQLANPALKVNITDPARRPFYGILGSTSTATPADQRFAARPRPISTLGQVQVRESTGKSLYRALTFRANLRKKWGQVNAFYTLSRNLSDDDNERDAGGIQFDNAYNLRPEYGLARIDRRHIFVANPVFFLPYGFEASSAIRLRSALPLDARQGTDLNQDGVNNDRPYSAAGVPFQRNGFRNLAQYDIDLRVQKRFSFTDRRSLVISAEFFNLFNLQNIQLAGIQATNYCASTTDRTCGFSGPTNTLFRQVKNPTTGVYLFNNNPGAPFQAQLGARFQF
jgi:hypothetical protein